MNRDEAIDIIANSKLEKLSEYQRESLLLDYWSINKEDPIFNSLSNELQQEIIFNEDGPIKPPIDERYNLFLVEILKENFIGIKNEYISKIISSILSTNINVIGHEEILFACPCCLYKTIKTFGQYEICPVCFWENDGNIVAERYSSANHMTLLEGRNNFEIYGYSSNCYASSIPEDVKERYYRADTYLYKVDDLKEYCKY